MTLKNIYRSTPVESLHTVLLGACKYMLRAFMDSTQKKEIGTMVQLFPYCGFSCRITGNIQYYKSFVGRDFKAFMQMAMFIVPTIYVSESETKCWFLLSKVNIIQLKHVMFLDFSSYILPFTIF